MTDVQFSLRDLREKASGPLTGDYLTDEEVLALMEAVEAARTVADAELKRNGFVPVELFERLHDALARFTDHEETA